MNKKNTMNQRTPKKNKLERDSEGKPKITLKELKETAVNMPTQEKYDTLMQVYECGEWRWIGGNLPTQGNLWNMYWEKTCVSVKSRFGYGNEKCYRKTMRYKVISIKKFCKMQNITPDMFREIKNYFETKK